MLSCKNLATLLAPPLTIFFSIKKTWKIRFETTSNVSNLLDLLSKFQFEIIVAKLSNTRNDNNMNIYWSITTTDYDER